MFVLFLFFFFNDTATTEIYTLSLHDALPISSSCWTRIFRTSTASRCAARCARIAPRSEEHTSELQSHSDLVCRLLLEKKKKTQLQHRRVDMFRVTLARALAASREADCQHRQQ